MYTQFASEGMNPRRSKLGSQIDLISENSLPFLLFTALLSINPSLLFLTKDQPAFDFVVVHIPGTIFIDNILSGFDFDINFTYYHTNNVFIMIQSF